MSHDRLVCGINNSAVQKRLLAKTDLTLAEAILMAQAAENFSQPQQVLTTCSQRIKRSTSLLQAPQLNPKTIMLSQRNVIIVVQNTTQTIAGLS